MKLERKGRQLKAPLRPVVLTLEGFGPVSMFPPEDKEEEIL